MKSIGLLRLAAGVGRPQMRNIRQWPKTPHWSLERKMSSSTGIDADTPNDSKPKAETPKGPHNPHNPHDPSYNPPRQVLRSVVCIGRNYADHIAELGNPRPEEPFFFLKPVTSILLPPVAPVAPVAPVTPVTPVSPGDPESQKNPVDIYRRGQKVLIPKGCDLYHEVELGVIIRKTIDEWKGGMEEFKDIVGGYRVAIDITARNYQAAAKEKGLPWALSKGMKTFCPVSEWIPREEIPDPHDVELYLKVNGKTRQQDSTKLMLFDIPRLLRHVSSVMPFGRPDILLTGTPKGTGKLVPGDKVTAGLRVNGKEVELGKIEFEVVEREGGYGSESAQLMEKLYAEGKTLNDMQDLLKVKENDKE